jgi:hypothetical protein
MVIAALDGWQLSDGKVNSAERKDSTMKKQKSLLLARLIPHSFIS